VRLLPDENVEKALLNVFPWRESNLGLRRRHPGLDVVRVVDVGLGGRSDPEILEWAAREGRVVVSRDRATLSADLRRGTLLAGARLRPPRHPAQGGGPGGLRPPLPPRGRPVRGLGEGGEIEEEVEEKARGEGP
jgi:predicted nuclease of predicted toxin-antitoxin system